MKLNELLRRLRKPPMAIIRRDIQAKIRGILDECKDAQAKALQFEIGTLKASEPKTNFVGRHCVVESKQEQAEHFEVEYRFEAGEEERMQ